MSSKSAQKGSRFEYKIRDMLTDKTGVKWERVPMSGALDSMKGDLFCPVAYYYHCFECKSYKDSTIQDNLLTAKSNNLYPWWEQTVREAEHMSKKPALVFKKDRGKPIIATDEKEEGISFLMVNNFGITIYLYDFTAWLAKKEIKELVLKP